MKESWNFDRCIAVLNGELTLLKGLSSARDNVRQAVLKREWADFEEKTAEINRIGEEFALLENERASLFAALRNGSAYGASSPEEAEKPFYAIISSLPLEESRELSRLYRELRMETLKLKALNETFMAYLNEAKTMAAAYLEAICPARGGKLYTRKGRRVSQDLKSIVFNNRF